jgi:hypothetical protein
MCSLTNKSVRAMTSRRIAALTASLSAAALILAANETFAGTAAVSRGGAAPTHSFSRPSIGQPFRHHHRNSFGAFWPGGDFPYGPNGEPVGDVGPPASSGADVHYTYTQDVPWDWAHRYPPAVAPSDRPYVPSCGAEAVKVPGRYGEEQTINITRCY